MYIISINAPINLTTEIINVGLKRNTAFVIWNGEFAQGDYQYNNKMVLKIYLILENTS
jgi:hypothetical protein